MMETIDWRIPVRIEKTTIPVINPMTMPRMVKPERNLCPIMLSIAIFRTSFGNELVSNILFSGQWSVVGGQLDQIFLTTDDRPLFTMFWLMPQSGLISPLSKPGKVRL